MQHFLKTPSAYCSTAGAFVTMNISLQFFCSKSQGRNLGESADAIPLVKKHWNQINNFSTLAPLAILLIKKFPRNIFQNGFSQHHHHRDWFLCFYQGSIFVEENNDVWRKTVGCTNIKALLHIQHCQLGQILTTLLNISQHCTTLFHSLWDFDNNISQRWIIMF